MGPPGGGRRPGVPGLLPGLPRPDEPDAYERTLPEVFPDTAPGSFTHVPELGGWVWTTFHDYQWDLDYTNPAVFRGDARHDARPGQPRRGRAAARRGAVPVEAAGHRLPEPARGAPAGAGLPGADPARRARACCSRPRRSSRRTMLVQYLGAHDRYRPECDLAYHNQLMVMLWSSLATRDARLAAQALSRMRPAPPATGWVTYLRCHDDIGWAVSDDDAAAVGWNGFDHRRFLGDFYAGQLPGSFARGAMFQENPATGDARTSGHRPRRCAGSRRRWPADDRRARAAVRRLETALLGGLLLRRHPAALHGRRARAAQRPRLGRRPGARRRQPLAAPAADGLGRRRAPALDPARWRAGLRPAPAAGRRPAVPAGAAGRRRDAGLVPDDPHVLAYRRRHRRSAPLLALANFSDGWQSVDLGLVAAAGIVEPEHVHSTRGRLDVGEGRLHLPPWGFSWLTNR